MAYQAQVEAPVAVIADQLRALLDYDPEKGLFTWRINKSSVARAGTTAGGRHNAGYVSIRIDGIAYLCHRLAWLHAYGRWPADQLDHVNGDRADNRLSNLRECSNAENCQNVRAHQDSTSRYAGVCRVTRTGNWLAQLTVNGKRYLAKEFKTEAEAAAAYAAAKRKFHLFAAGA